MGEPSKDGGAGLGIKYNFFDCGLGNCRCGLNAVSILVEVFLNIVLNM